MRHEKTISRIQSQIVRFTALGLKAINGGNKKPINQSIKINKPFSQLRIALH